MFRLIFEIIAWIWTLLYVKLYKRFIRFIVRLLGGEKQK